MLRVFGIFVSVVAAGLGVWLASHYRPSPNYYGENICSAPEIGATYEAINGIGAWHSAAILRTNYEFSLHRQERNLRNQISRGLTFYSAKIFGHRTTAAALCGHAYVRFNNAPPLRTVPAVADALSSKLGDGPDLWQVATCLALRGGASSLDIETVSPQQLRDVCLRLKAKITRYN